MTCFHSWTPLPSWFGRYRCDLCRVLAYKQVSTGSMKVYVCSKCDAPAVTHGESQLCKHHADQKK